MSKISLWLFSGCGVAALATGFALNRHWIEAAIVTLAAGGWLAAQLIRTPLARLAGILALSGMVILGALENMPPTLIILAWSSLLAAWDLAEFRQRLAYSLDDAMRRRTETRHLQKLLLIIGIGASGALVIASMQLTLSFGSVLLVGLLSLAALGGLSLLLAQQAKIE